MIKNRPNWLEKGGEEKEETTWIRRKYRIKMQSNKDEGGEEEGEEGEVEVMEQQDQIHGCSQGMIGGPRCL